MHHLLRPISAEDRQPIIDIFNHYIENSFAAYPEQKLPCQAFDMLMHLSNGYPTTVLEQESGRISGFGMLRPHSPIPTFSRSAEVTYFLHPDYTGHGLGQLLLMYFERSAKKIGIHTLLANISSLNHGSVRFHERYGFEICGHFMRVGQKNNTTFDTIWMQKFLS